MGLIQTIITILFIVLVIMTFINQPKLSADYYKEMGKSFIKVGYWCKEAVSNIIGLFKNNTTQVKP